MYKDDPKKAMERDIKHQVRINGTVSVPYLMRKYGLSPKEAKQISENSKPVLNDV